MKTTTKIKFFGITLILASQSILSVPNRLALVEDRSITIDSVVNQERQPQSNNPNNSNNFYSEPSPSYRTEQQGQSSNQFMTPNTVQPRTPAQGGATPDATHADFNKPAAFESNQSNPEVKALEKEIENNDYDNQKMQERLQELQAMPFASRLQRLENITEDQKRLKLEKRVKLLQLQLQELTGLLEAQQHKFEQVFAQDKLLHESLERRISQLISSNNTISNNTSITPIIPSTPNNSSTKNISSKLNPTSSTTPSDTTSIPSEEKEVKKSYTYKDSELDQQSLYNSAYENIKLRKYDQAITAFTQYNSKFPNGQYSESSHYWLGEIYMLQSKYDKALGAFNTVLTKHPKGQKSADAMYKKGLVYLYQKDFMQAKKVLTQVVKLHSNTTAASLAEKQLKNIEAITRAA
ncbi:MAG: tol-pal system protein YbgF [Gammaproteobacteria bacterium]|nr:tol-pal system protein YbgF [Gammaproteobacteria bacterium]